MATTTRKGLLGMSLGQLVIDKDRKKYIYQYLFLMIIVFVGVPIFFGGFTTSGFWLNFIVVHILFVWLISGKEKERTERLRKKRVRDLTQGR